MSALEQTFVKYSVDKLQQLAGRIEDCLSRLTDEQIWIRNSENENALGNLVLHLCGNLNQWIGTGIAGDPDTRNRDAEFAARGGVPRTELSNRLRQSVQRAIEIIRPLTPAQLEEKHSTQGYRITNLEAIYHVVEHFSYHTGQIIFVTKFLTGQDLGYYKHLSGKAASAADPTP